MNQAMTWSREHGHSEDDKIIMHCDLNNYFASVELLDRPELRDKPVIVGGSTEMRHGIVLAKNYPAKKYGIITGESVSQAMGKCPSLVSLEPHYDKYLHYSRVVRDIYLRYTDQIEAMGIDESFLDVTGSEYLYGKDMANRIRTEVKEETGLTISVGVSFNKIFAKLGSDMKKPDAVTLIPKDSFREVIWDLPAYELLGCGMPTYKKLWYRGIRTIGDLARADPEMLRSYLGKQGAVLWAYANGYESSSVMEENERAPIKSIGHGTTAKFDLDNEREVFDVIIELSEEIGMKLRKNGLRSGGVSVTVRESNLEVREYQMKFGESTQLAREIANGAMRVFHEKHIWSLGIRSVTVRAIYIITNSTPEQLSIGDDPADAEKKERLLRLESAVDSLRERYGDHCVSSGTYFGGSKLSSQRFGFKDHSEIF